MELYYVSKNTSIQAFNLKNPLQFQLYFLFMKINLIFLGRSSKMPKRIYFQLIIISFELSLLYTPSESATGFMGQMMSMIGFQQDISAVDTSKDIKALREDLKMVKEKANRYSALVSSISSMLMNSKYLCINVFFFGMQNANQFYV